MQEKYTLILAVITGLLTGTTVGICIIAMSLQRIEELIRSAQQRNGADSGQSCPYCHGTGVVPDNYIDTKECEDCNGTGQV